MTHKRPIDPSHARRLIISKQRLDVRPKLPMLDLIRELGCLQLDPIRKVERTHLLVLWSRLGNYNVDELEKLRWKDVSLFEYWAHAASLVLTEDYPIHATTMTLRKDSDWMKTWLDENDLHDLHQQMVNRLKKDYPLGTNDFESEQYTEETFSGWTTGKAVNRLMDRMWRMGEVLPAKREGNQRKWALTEDVLPDWTPLTVYSPYEASYQAVQRAVKALGVAMDKKHINYHFTRNRYFEYKSVKQQLLDEGKLIPVQIGDWDKDWFMHLDDLPLLEKIEAGDWSGRTTLLSPFDNLICDRDRTELIWNFRFRIEIYVPQKKREFGYYVLPILHHDDLIGRMDMAMDRKTNTLDIIATYAEDDAPADAVTDISDAVDNLADFLGAEKITYGKKMPTIWKALPKH
ncbi:MAG: crosslink repair DNA glycosylase YcaQ family protein [Chloroflexota bacterium]